jgi:lipoyl(octanoyl) transferase
MIPRLQIQSNLKSAAPVRWEIADGMVDYEFAVARMEAEVAAIAAGTASELVWLVEHPALYTAGTSAEDKDLIAPARFPVYQTGRGGQYTYHGPGQRVAYVMLNLKRRGSDVRAFVTGLEQWIIATLDQFNIKGERREERVGVWVTRGDREDKIAALGIRLRHWVSYHGISINVDPDLKHFDGIVPCGINEHGVTSLVDLGLPAVMADLDIALKSKFIDVFGASQ